MDCRYGSVVLCCLAAWRYRATSSGILKKWEEALPFCIRSRSLQSPGHEEYLRCQLFLGALTLIIGVSEAVKTISNPWCVVRIGSLPWTISRSSVSSFRNEKDASLVLLNNRRMLN
jgi:hypothetical protein